MHTFPADEDWSFLLGRTLEFIFIASTKVELWMDNDVKIEIHSCFEVLTGTGDSSPADKFARIGLLPSLIGRVISSAATESETVLVLTFSEGEVLRLITESCPYERLVFHTGKDFMVF